MTEASPVARVLCRVFGHRINEYRAARVPNLVAMGCSRCHRMVDVRTMQVTR